MPVEKRRDKKKTMFLFQQIFFFNFAIYQNFGKTHANLNRREKNREIK